MKSVIVAALAALGCAMPAAAQIAQEPQEEEAQLAERYKTAMQSARWMGPMLAATASTLPKGHFFTQPYFFDSISGGKHHPGSTGFYQYGLLDEVTVGFQPNFAWGVHGPDRGPAMGDLKLLGQVRLTNFTPEHRIPTVSLILNESLPVGEYDRLDRSEVGHGSGSFATEVGVNLQQYFLLKNGRLLRGRINVLQRFPHGADVEGKSVYGTGPGFRGHASPAKKTTLIVAVEYSLTREWVLALDVIRESTTKSTVKGRYGDGSVVEQVFPSTRYVGFAPAVEYNWSDTTGVLLGIWVAPKGHNRSASVTPAISFARFW